MNLESIVSFIKSIKTRVINNPNTTVSGGIFGVGLASVIGYFEQKSGCKFEAAFGNIDWLQLVSYVFMQTHGALSTDANKTINGTETVVQKPS